MQSSEPSFSVSDVTFGDSTPLSHPTSDILSVDEFAERQQNDPPCLELDSEDENSIVDDSVSFNVLFIYFFVVAELSNLKSSFFQSRTNIRNIMTT